MRRLLIIILVLLSIHSAYGQDRKLRRVKELLVEKKNSEADEIIKELIDKYPTLPTVLYYSSLVDLQLNRSLDSIYQKMKFGNKNLTNLRYVNNNSDSAELGFTKEEFQRFKQQIEGLAFDRYYKNAKTTDSLQLFIAKFDVSNTQRGYIENRICDISARFALTSVDVSVLRDFINNHKNCVELKMVESRLLALNWQSAKKFNTYKSYEMFAQENPSSIFGDSIKMAIEILDWEKTQFNDSISSYESFILKYPSSKFNNIASDKIDTLRWLPISTSGTLSELHDFVTRYPQSQFNKQAKDSIVKLEWFSIALTKDIEPVNRFLEKYPNSNYEIQARNRQDELLWGNCNKPILSELKLYVDKCVLCGHKDEALEKISVLEWTSVKNTNDTNLLNLFIKTYPKSSKLKDAIERREQFIKQFDLLELKKIFYIIPRDSFETEDFLSHKAPNNSVSVNIAKNGDRTIQIFSQKYESPNMEVCDCPENQFNYQGYSKLLKCHVIIDQEGYIDYQYIIIGDDGSSKKLNPSIRHFSDITILDAGQLRLISADIGGDAIMGFKVLKWKLGEIELTEESEYFDFGKNGGIEKISFVTPSRIKVNAFIYDTKGMAKPFETEFIYDDNLKLWKHLKG
jgi:TolA-binding protein